MFKYPYSCFTACDQLRECNSLVTVLKRQTYTLYKVLVSIELMKKSYVCKCIIEYCFSYLISTLSSLRKLQIQKTSLIKKAD